MDDTVTRPAAVQVLGIFELRVAGRAVVLPLQAQRVLGYLAVVQQGQTRSAVAGSLWSESSQQRAMAALRNALWRLGRTGPSLVSTVGDHLRLRPDVATDLALAHRCAGHLGAGDIPAVEGDLVELFDADLLPGWDEDWLVVERERTRQLRIHALERLSRTLVSRGRTEQGIQAALVAVGAEPLRESAQAVLISAHLSEGNVSEAVRQLDDYRGLLARELGLRPSPRLEALVRPHAASAHR